MDSRQQDEPRRRPEQIDHSAGTISMNASVRIAVADDEPRMRQFYEEVLPVLGHQVVCAAETGKELVGGCQTSRPDLVITDIKMPDMDGIEAAFQICRTEPVPVILVSAYDDLQLVSRAGENHIQAYLVKPIKQQDLQPAIIIAMRRFQEFHSLHKEATDLRQALQDRKTIERAKGMIMKRGGLDEPAAFQALRKLARDKNIKLVEVAEMFLTVEEALEPRKEV
jgi:two-component system, response regulator PdtaR